MGAALLLSPGLGVIFWVRDPASGHERIESGDSEVVTCPIHRIPQ
jgi:hypothetical protein